MATHTFHDPDGGIGFDMRNAHLYHDSDDEDEIEERHRPRPYTPKSESGCNCCFILVILIILIAGSIIGYSLGSSFTAPQPYEAATNPPKPTSSNTYVRHTPSPHVRKDPFHNHGKGQKGGITAVFTQNTPKPTPQSISTLPEPPPQDNADTTPVVDKPAFEPSAAVEKPAFEPSAAIEKPAFEPSAAVQKPAFEPSAVEKPAFEPSAAVQKPAVEKPSNPKQIENDVDLGDIISDLERKNKLKLIHTALALDDEYDLGDSVILSKLVLDGREIPHIFEHAQKFTVQYPANGKSYDINEYKTWCFHFYLYDYPAAQIDIKFNAFQLERGFDRVLIRHFNQSFLDPPVVYAGRGAFDAGKNPWILPDPVTYHLRRNEFKSVCVELESDDSVGLSGVAFDVSVKYDDCQWSEYTECSIPDESKKHWDRGPFYDGSCGIGVRSRQRRTKEQDKDAPSLNDVEGFVNCDNKDTTDIDGPEYCLKAPCETVDNTIKGIPDNIRYGWSNHTTFYNGIGTLDARYPDLLRILTASPSTPRFGNVDDVKQYLSSPRFVALYQSYPIYHVNPKRHDFHLDAIMHALEGKKKEILSEHVDERVLTLPVLKLKHIDQTMEWLGARLTHSLLIGRPFTMIFTGSSNTAGHDNQFASTYPIQLQSRLRTFWAHIGVDGAAMNVRNVAVGGSPKTDTMAWHVAARASENPSYPYNTVNDKSPRGLWRNEDVIVWESFMNDGGRPPDPATEEQLRVTALLNAIFGAMNSIDSKNEDECNAKKDWKDILPKHYLGREQLFKSLTNHYDEHMGIIQMDFESFVTVVCSEPKYKTLKINWHPNAGGHRCEADIYAYMLLTAAFNFIKTNQGTIEKHKGNKDVNVLDKWLLEKSGNWGEQYIKSIQNKDTNLFPAALNCQPFCDHTVAPFALKTAEPNEWDVAYRLTDYIVYDYDKMDDKTTAADSVEGLNNDLIPDRGSRFCVEQLLRSNGWRYVDRDRDPVHFPQDRMGKIGAMDRKRPVMIEKDIWMGRFKEFLQKNHPDDVGVFSQINDRDKGKKGEAKKVLGKYVPEWGDYVLENDYDVKIAFLVPEIGNHSILAFTEDGGTGFFGLNGNEKGLLGINLETMDRKNEVNKKYDYKYDFNKRLTEQRPCTKYAKQRGCVFHHISPGKYIMRLYPMNMTDDNIPGFVQVIAF